MKVKSLHILFLIILLGIVSYISSSDVRRFLSLYAQGSSSLVQDYELDKLSQSERGAVYFIGGDFGALSTDTLRGSAAPWALVATLITLDYVEGDLERVSWGAANAAYQQWGFLSKANFANWPEGLSSPNLNQPVGFNTGQVNHAFLPIRVTTANFTCAACHSGVAYDAKGQPKTDEIWLGQPNPSINLEAYPQAIYDSFLAHGDNPDLFKAMAKLFPNLSEREESTLKRFVLPAAQKRMAELKDTLGRATPFYGGLPGITNGVDSLHIRLGVQDPAEFTPLSAYNSVPNIDGHGFRTSFLNVGNYQLPSGEIERSITREDVDKNHLGALGKMVAFFTVPAYGVSPETAEKYIPQAQDAMHFAATLKTQPFPGEINAALAKDGETLFNQQCASCHGSYDAKGLKEFPNIITTIGSDTLRMNILIQAQTDKAINQSNMGKYIRAVEPKGYVAPPLSGIWATAPYFHNGSIPTLYHLFNPDTRPEKFYLGGQKLNFDLVGIDGQLAEGIWTYPEDYTPWSTPALFDTSKPGHGAQGHEAEFEALSDDDKTALIEYLKTL